MSEDTIDMFEGLLHNGTPTSKEAAEKCTTGSSVRAKILRLLKAVGDYGATDEEIQVALDIPGDTQRPRRYELVKRGYVRDSGVKRKTSSGRRAVVWIHHHHRRAAE